MKIRPGDAVFHWSNGVEIVESVYPTEEYGIITDSGSYNFDGKKFSDDKLPSIFPLSAGSTRLEFSIEIEDDDVRVVCR